MHFGSAGMTLRDNTERPETVTVGSNTLAGPQEGSILDTMRVAISKNGVPIRLTHKQWAYIVDSHDYMAGNMDLVIESVEDPDYIVRGWTDELVALKHYERTSISDKYMVVVYKEGDDGFIITAFMTSKPDKIMRRGTIWQR